MRLIEHLPAGAAYFRDQVGHPAAWTPGEHLAALGVDAQYLAIWATQAKGKRPEPMDRPGVGAMARAAREQSQNAGIGRDPIEMAKFLQRRRLEQQQHDEQNPT